MNNKSRELAKSALFLPERKEKGSFLEQFKDNSQLSKKFAELSREMMEYNVGSDKVSSKTFRTKVGFGSFDQEAKDKSNYFTSLLMKIDDCKGRIG